MQIKQEQLSPTSIKLSIVAEPDEITKSKAIALDRLGKNAKLSGFRAGKAPTALLEKSLDQAAVQNEFLNEAINAIYPDAANQTGLKIVDQPEISITKFVPFTALEFSATVNVIGDIKLADYHKIKLAPKKVSVTAKEVDAVMTNLAERSAIRTDVKRAAKLGDEVRLDFKGIDTKDKTAIAGADGKDYDLILGSQSFIPGFEDNLVGMKPDDNKDFDIVFPKDYSVKDLQDRKVTFSVTIHNVKSLKTPKLDDDFAKTVGPFKDITELKADVKKQLTYDKQKQADQAYENELMQKIADATTVSIPDRLVDQELTQIEDEERRNLAYRGQTWEEHLKTEGITEEEHRLRERPIAELRIKTGLILGEIAEKESITVSDDELDLRVNLLKGQYSDPQMQAELSKPEGRQDIRGRLLIEKTLDYLRQQASK